MRSTINGVQQRVGSSHHDLTSTITQLSWTGEDADLLIHRMRGPVSDDFNLCVSALQQLMETLERNSQAQLDASSSSGIGPGTVKLRDLKDPGHENGADVDKVNFYGDPIFGPDGPKKSDVEQGWVGDCWLMAALAGMANTPDGQAVLSKMIKDNGDGTYRVTFADGSTETVDGDFYTDPETGRPAYSKGAVLWPHIIEKAYAQRRGGSYNDVAGGWGSEALSDLGGWQTKKVPLNPSFKRDPSDSKIDGLIDAANKDGRVVVANSKTHVWTVISSEEGCVELRNPWGTNLSYERMRVFWEGMGVSGNEFKEWNQGGGILQVPIADFTAGWESIEYQLPADPR